MTFAEPPEVPPIVLFGDARGWRCHRTGYPASPSRWTRRCRCRSPRRGCPSIEAGDHDPVTLLLETTLLAPIVGPPIGVPASLVDQDAVVGVVRSCQLLDTVPMKLLLDDVRDRLGGNRMTGAGVGVVEGVERDAGDRDPVAAVVGDDVLRQKAAPDDVALRRDVHTVPPVGERLHPGVQRIDPDQVGLDDVAGGPSVCEILAGGGGIVFFSLVEVVLDPRAPSSVCRP